MPHKHKRKRDDDTSSFNLAPTSQAKPLAAYNKASIFTKEDETSSNKRRKPNGKKGKKPTDDTPKAFARLMAWQETGKRPKGLDDGVKPTKKQRKEAKPKPESSDTTTPSNSNQQTKKPPPKPKSEPTPTPASTTQPPTIPKILPGETLSSFSLRVDQTLPLSSISKTTNPNLPSDLAAKLKNSVRVTKHNKRLQKMQADWRSNEAKLRELEAERADEAEETREEEDILWSGVQRARDSVKGKKKRAVGKGEEDPWKELEKKRSKQKNLQDVVKAPPTLNIRRVKVKVRREDLDAVDGKVGVEEEDDDVVVDVGSVPGRMGSLRRREELNETRRAVIEGYRNMRGKKRGVSERLSMSRAVMT